MPDSVGERTLRVDEVRQWIARRYGIEYPDGQYEILRDRLRKACRRCGLTLSKLHKALVDGDLAVSQQVAAMVSTNHTFFFREPEIFEHFRTVALPAFAARPLRVWSAAASTGDEAYSIAMTAQEELGVGGVRVLGTDLSADALGVAENAVYGADHLTLVTPLQRSVHFDVEGAEVRVRPEVRAVCTFRRLNLVELPYPFSQRFHVVFLRNVLYYFDTATRQRVLDATYDVAETGAFLYTSLTEPLLDIGTRWRQVGPAIFQKVTP